MDAIDLLNDHLKRREALAAGQQSRLARHLDVSPGLIWQWLNRKRPIAPERVIEVASFTEFMITPHQLRPDIYPNPLDGLPPDFDVTREDFVRSLPNPDEVGEGRAA